VGLLPDNVTGWLVRPGGGSGAATGLRSSRHSPSPERSHPKRSLPGVWSAGITIGDKATATDAQRPTASGTLNSAARSLPAWTTSTAAKSSTVQASRTTQRSMMSQSSSTVRSRGDHADGETSCTHACSSRCTSTHAMPSVRARRCADPCAALGARRAVGSLPPRVRRSRASLVWPRPKGPVLASVLDHDHRQVSAGTSAPSASTFQGRR
jgi:hypothetical protein